VWANRTCCRGSRGTNLASNPSPRLASSSPREVFGSMIRSSRPRFGTPLAKKGSLLSHFMSRILFPGFGFFSVDLEIPFGLEFWAFHHGSRNFLGYCYMGLYNIYGFHVASIFLSSTFFFFFFFCFLRKLREGEEMAVGVC
jgi:hypothetical protein